MSKSILAWQSVEINLLQEPKKQTGMLPFIVMMAIAAAAILAVPVWLWIDAKRSVAVTGEHLEQLNANIARLEAQIRANAGPGNSGQFIRAIDRLRDYRPNATDVLEALQGLLPKEAEVLSLTLSGGAHAELMMQTASVEQVITFMNALEQSDRFRLVTFSPMTNAHPAPESLPGRQPAGAGAEEADGSSGQAAILPVTTVTFQLEYVPASAGESGGSE